MSSMPRIDAHQHFWKIARGDYSWMSDEVDAIRHDILPPDLSPYLIRHGICATVVVQAADSVEETEFLINLSKEYSFINGIVGWVDLENNEAPLILDRLMQYPVFKGVRPMLQDIEDTNWIQRPMVRNNLMALAERGLRLDALVTERHLDAILQVASDYPDLPIVIDHCAKPKIANSADAGNHWRERMAQLARLSNVYCKVSGLANEAGDGWTVEQLKPVVDHVITHFGSGKTMWGSDWPVLNLVGEYDGWVAASEQLFSGLPRSDHALIFGGTAASFYNLEVSS